MCRGCCFTKTTIWEHYVQLHNGGLSLSFLICISTNKYHFLLKHVVIHSIRVHNGCVSLSLKTLIMVLIQTSHISISHCSLQLPHGTHQQHSEKQHLTSFPMDSFSLDVGPEHVTHSITSWAIFIPFLTTSPHVYTNHNSKITKFMYYPQAGGEIRFLYFTWSNAKIT